MANFFDRIADAAARFPDRVAIEWVAGSTTEATTYRALIAEAGAVASWLVTVAGIRAGDRVAILAANDAHWVAAYLGILRLGAIAVPLDTNYAAAQVGTILRDSGSGVLLTSHKLEHIGCEAIGSDLETRLEVLPLTHAAASPAVAAVPSDAVAVIIYTSGTTADPKGVVLTHANLDAERAGAFGIVDVTETDVVLGVLPLFHALAQMANLLLPLSVGAKVIFLETVSSSTLVEALQTRAVTVFACVPQFFYLIHERVMSDVAMRGGALRVIVKGLIRLNSAMRDQFGWNAGPHLFGRVHRAFGSRMRILVTGGSRFDPGIARDLHGLGLSVLNAYGLTETSGGATMMRPGDRFTSSVGQPFPGVEIRIAPRTRSTTDAIQPEGEAPDDGEVLIRGPIVMREYFNRPDRTAEALRDGWLHTGDLGRLDAEGRLSITGRLKEIIVLSSGKNLYPEEIEAHYRQSSFIKELAVLGRNRPGEPASERLHAVVVPDEAALRARGAVNVRELVRFELEELSVKLPAHKRVLSYDITFDALPRTTTGKLRRAEIERRIERDATSADAARPLTEAEQVWTAASTDRAALVGTIARRMNRDAVAPDANLELDLGLDSMERVELLAMLEDACRVKVAAEVQATIFTIRQLIEAVERAPRSDHARTTAPGDRAWQAILRAPPDPELARELTRSKFLRAALLYALLALGRLVAVVAIGFRSRGRTNVPASGPVILAPNHQTYLDGFFVVASLPFTVFRRLFVVGASEYFDTPIKARLARAFNIVPVDPDVNLVRAMQAAATGLRNGRVLVLFPEGERSIDGELKPFRKGAAILASHLDVPIVPTAIDGFFPLWPRGRPFNWRALARAGDRTSVVFGAPLHLAHRDEIDGTRELERAVAALLRARGDASRPTTAAR